MRLPSRLRDVHDDDLAGPGRIAERYSNRPRLSTDWSTLETLENRFQMSPW